MILKADNGGIMRAVILSLLCLTLGEQCLAQALVDNGDFELSGGGKADGWNYEVTEFLQVAKEPSGNSYLKYDKSKEEYFDAKQTVDLPGSPENLMLYARVRLKGFRRDEAQRWKCPMVATEFIKADGSRQKEKGIHLTSDSGDEWFSMYRIIKVPRSSQQVELVLVNDAAGGEVHFDDISIVTDPVNEMLPLDVVNTAGRFEVETEDETIIFGWQAHRSSRIQIIKAGGNSYLGLQGDRYKTTLNETILRVDPAWKKLRVTCRMKSESLEVGFSPTHTAKLVLEFVDSEAKKIDQWITPLQLKKNTPDWTEMKSEFTVPDGAAGLRIAPTIARCNGEGHFDDIKVEVLR